MIEFRLLRKLQEAGETVTGQTKKQTQNPTLKWPLFRFRYVWELRFQAGEAGNSACYEHDPGVPEDPAVARAGVRKLLCMSKDLWKMGERRARKDPRTAGDSFSQEGLFGGP